jgi:RimJ/RimL family protein N-acetyltransferase
MEQAARPPEVIEVRAGLQLRRQGPDDAVAIAEAITASLPELQQWMPWASAEPTTDPDFQRRRLEEAHSLWDEGSEFVYVIVLEGTVAGAMGLHARRGPGALEIGYWLRSDLIGRGIVTACAEALTTVALSLAEITQVEIHCDEANTRSAGIPQRLGYRLAKVEPDEVTAPGEVGRDMTWVYPPS